MRHFISYHNAAKMGYAHDDATRFSVQTAKSVDRLLNNRIWSVSGEGEPRSYFLRETWFVTETGRSEEDELNYAFGSAGLVFGPPVLLNPLAWFPRFLKSQSNFSLGLQPIKDEFVAEFEALAVGQRKRLERAADLADDIEHAEAYREGTVIRIAVNAYERNAVARMRCIEHYGVNCFLCGFNFGQTYGPEVDGLIHVHHLRSLSELGGEYTVDPVADLRPVCPNCHAVLHSRRPAYSISEVAAFLKSCKKS